MPCLLLLGLNFCMRRMSSTHYTHSHDVMCYIYIILYYMYYMYYSTHDVLNMMYYMCCAPCAVLGAGSVPNEPTNQAHQPTSEPISVHTHTA